MFKSLIIRLFLSKEAAALKSRLAEASATLQRIEATVVRVEKNASPEVHKLAADVLSKILRSADQVREKEHGFVHEWEELEYAVYAAGKPYAESTINYAHKLIDETKIFFKK